MNYSTTHFFNYTMTQDKSQYSHSVSVVLCTYNGEKYLREQLDSLLAQTYPLHEIIIQDDQSTDGTMAILREYADKYPVIKLFVHEERSTVNDNFFSAMQRATGDFISISDQDDIWLPHKIATLVDNIENNLCCFHLSNEFRNTPNYQYADPRIINANPECTLFRARVPGHTMLIRKQLLDITMQHIPADVLCRFSSAFYYDTILSIVAMVYGKIKYIPTLLDFHRMHSASCTSCTSINRRDLSQRTIKNAVLLVLRNLKPSRRHIIKPLIINRMQCEKALLDCFPDANPAYTRQAYKIIAAYTKTASWRHPLSWIVGECQFVCLLVQSRNALFYSKEKNQAVATLRALTYPITMYDHREDDYQRIIKQKRL